ncbi:MAG: DUF4253 domain-containing protein [Pedobacter sp.]|uniref:DUF4253 domain-containing protein n=1 Tax=Pedobacter sp. TaxID=1411316 RepID=UPI002809A137|nr:DUF4253 domain-containing protein [Pedobacter sp.]MDQ8003570.1 DUF4253 domain-containing protein [Pedobacter sp.]
MNSQRIQIFLLAILTFAIGCNSSTTEKSYILTKEERNICDSLRLDTTIIKDIRDLNTSKIEPFHYSLSKIITKDSEIEADPIFLKGLVFSEANTKSYDLVFSLKDKFKQKGYSIFLLENNFNNKPDNIGVLNTIDKFTILKQVATDGINWNITNDSLISIIKGFDKKYSLELIGASGDWCEFIIHNEPKNWDEFAKEVYKVCPDVVDQGAGSVEVLADEMKKTKRLYFWWD